MKLFDKFYIIVLFLAICATTYTIWYLLTTNWELYMKSVASTFGLIVSVTGFLTHNKDNES